MQTDTWTNNYHISSQKQTGTKKEHVIKNGTCHKERGRQRKQTNTNGRYKKHYLGPTLIPDPYEMIPKIALGGTLAALKRTKSSKDRPRRESLVLLWTLVSPKCRPKVAFATRGKWKIDPKTDLRG